MKLPVPAPQVEDLLPKYGKRLLELMGATQGPELNGTYEHWDKMRHRTPPAGMTPEEWWLGIKMRRSGLARALPLRDKTGKAFTFGLTDSMQRRLHFIDMEAAGSIRGIEDAGSQERFLLRSLIEEAMTSSQLEGASTTRAVAKEMLATRRQPRDQSERMIYNNHVAMNIIRERGKRPITPQELIELHSILTEGTLEHPGDSGRLRTQDDNVVIYDRGSPPTLLHVPPPAAEASERLQKLCDFANDTESAQFVHPVVRAIAVHFQIGYDHPFVDGNGRTARALFYWSMMNSGYWLTEYFSISSVLKKSPGKYMQAYLHTESDGRDMSYFIAQQLESIEQAIQGLHDYIARKHAKVKAAQKIIKGAHVGGITLNHRQRALLANALKDPDRFYTVASHRAAHTITYPTALNDLNGLISASLFQRIKVGKAFEYYPAPDLAGKLS